MPRLYQPLTTVLIAAGLVAAVALEIRIAVSAQLLRNASTDAMLHAARLTPADEDIYLRLADLDPDRRSVYLHKASKANPYDPRPWLDQGFMAEADGNLNEAERDFREAARLDLRTAPSWALANFYFRHSDTHSFLFWANQYRAYAKGNVAALYRLAYQRDPHVATILKEFSPMTCTELEGLATFLDTRASPADTVAVDQSLASCPGEEGASVLVADVSHLLMADQPNAALRIWRSLHPAGGGILTNVAFADELDEIGFNWRINRTAGIRVRRLPERHSVEFSFDGSEPEVSTLLFQPVVLAAGTSYQLSCRVRSEEEHESGFSWRLVELTTGKTLENGIGEASKRRKNLLSWTFQAPASSRTLVLAFTYVRPAGEIKKDGKVELGDLTLFPIGNQASLVNDAASPTAP